MKDIMCVLSNNPWSYFMYRLLQIMWVYVMFDTVMKQELILIEVNR